MDRTEKAKEILERIRYVTIATASKAGEPWNTPVFAVHDNEYNFYWVSWFGTQHSKNISENPSVFMVVYDSTAPEGAGEGVYLKARASELTDSSEMERAIALVYTGKSEKVRTVEMFQGDNPRRIYKAAPEQVWVNLDADVKGNIIDTRKEIYLI